MSDDDLIRACSEMTSGLFDADLGDNVYKKRIALGNRGKRAGYRTIIGAVVGEKYFFLYAFAKKAKANINEKERVALKELAKVFLSFSQDDLDQLVEDGELIRVDIDHE